MTEHHNQEHTSNPPSPVMQRALRIQEAMRKRGISTNLTTEEARMVILPANVYYESDSPKAENKTSEGENRG
jgi:hypothetical protein